MTINLKEITESINDFTFECKIPSTGETVMGKPYTIKDSFKLAQIQTLENKNNIFKVLLDVIKSKYYSMTTEQFDKLTLVDLQWLFIYLKINSSEIYIPTEINCGKCSKSFDYNLDLNKVKVGKGDFEKTIIIKNDKIKKELGIVLKSYSLKDILEMDMNDENVFDKNKDKIFQNIIKSICYGEECSDVSTFTQDEISNFINELPVDCYDDFNKFIVNQPELFIADKIQCPHCKNEIDFPLNDFFMLLF